VGHETALPSLLGTKRAGLGDLRVDLAMAAREGKPLLAIKSSSDHPSPSARPALRGNCPIRSFPRTKSGLPDLVIKEATEVG